MARPSALLAPAAVYVDCKQPGTRAKWALTLVDQAEQGEQPKHISFVEDEPDIFNPTWGFSKFASHEKLRSRPGYLAGDRLVLRAAVEVVL